MLHAYIQYIHDIYAYITLRCDTYSHILHTLHICIHITRKDIHTYIFEYMHIYIHRLPGLNISQQTRRYTYITPHIYKYIHYIHTNIILHYIITHIHTYIHTLHYIHTYII